MFSSDSSAANNGFRDLLKNRSFLLLWGGQVISQVADKVLLVLLIALVQTDKLPISETALLQTYNSAIPEDILLQIYESAMPENSMYSGIMVAFTLPAILFGSAAGIFVDRLSKKQVLVVSNLIRGVLTLAILLLPKQFFMLLAIAFLISTVTQFFAPAEQTAIPLLVQRENLMSANAFTTTMMGSLIVGFAVGAPLLNLAKQLGGDSTQEIFVAALYLAAGALCYPIQIKENIRSNRKRKHNAIGDFRKGLRYLWKNSLVKNAMLQLVILYSVFAALTVLAIPLAKQFDLQAEEFGFLLAAAGVGLVFGAGILGHWGDRFQKKPLPLIGFLIVAFVLAVFTLTQRLWLGLGLSAVLGLGASLIGVPMQTAIHQQTSESMRGKVFGIQNNAVNIALSLPLVLTGLVTDVLSKVLGSEEASLRLVLLSISLPIALVGIWAWRSSRRVLQDVI